MSNESMISTKFKISKIIALLAFAFFLISLFLPYARFDVTRDLFTGVRLKLYALLIIVIPLLIFSFLKTNRIQTIIALIIIALLGIAGFWMLFLYLGGKESYPLKLGIGIYLYFLMVMLFFIAMILKMKARKETNTDVTIIDDVWN